MRFLVGAVLLVAFAACTQGVPAGETTARPEAYLYSPTREDLLKTITLDGVVSPQRKSVVFASAGANVRVLNAQLGKRVQRDDVLLEYDSGSFTVEFTRLQNSVSAKDVEIKNSILQLNGLNKKLDTTRALVNRKIAARNELDDVQRQVFESRNNLSVKKNDLETERRLLTEIKRKMSNLSVKSPIAGIVTSLWIGSDTFVPGSSVKEGEKIMTISDPSDIVIEVSIPEAEVGLVKRGQRGQISGGSIQGEALEGLVADLSDSPSAEKASGVQYYPAKIKILNPPDSVKIGMTVQADIVLAEKKGVLTVPLHAVRRDGPKYFVEVQNSSGAFEKRGIQLGLANDTTAEVVAGLSEGEKIRVP